MLFTDGSACDIACVFLSPRNPSRTKNRGDERNSALDMISFRTNKMTKEITQTSFAVAEDWNAMERTIAQALDHRWPLGGVLAGTKCLIAINDHRRRLGPGFGEGGGNWKRSSLLRTDRKNVPLSVCVLDEF